MRIQRIANPIPRTSEFVGSDDKGNVTVQRVQRCDDILDGIKGARDLAPGKNMRHIGSIPLIIAARWAKECGAGIGTAEFAAYAKKKLMDSDWAELRVHSL